MQEWSDFPENPFLRVFPKLKKFKSGLCSKVKVRETTVSQRFSYFFACWVCIIDGLKMFTLFYTLKED